MGLEYRDPKAGFPVSVYGFYGLGLGLRGARNYRREKSGLMNKYK